MSSAGVAPRIAYIINSVEGGGAALPVPAIVDVLRRGGAEVAVFALTRRDGRALPAIIAAGIDVTVREGGETDHGRALAWLDRRVANWAPSHLWTSLTRATLLGQIVGVRRRLPVVSWQHAAFLKPGNRRLLRAMRRLSDVWVADSDAVAALTHARLGVPWERLMLWPIFRADPDAPRARAWAPGEAVRIGSLGRLHAVKGYDVLVEALARLPAGLPPYEVHIAGDGAARDAILRLAADRGVTRLRLAGYAEHPRDFLATCHLYVQPSRSEGLCVAAHEAMQAGLPVLASAVGQLPHSITPDCGAVVPPGDPQALAAALAALLAQPGRLRGLGQAARNRVLDRFGPARFDAAGGAILARIATL